MYSKLSSVPCRVVKAAWSCRDSRMHVDARFLYRACRTALDAAGLVLPERGCQLELLPIKG